jgi:hypothetical protein
MLRGVIRSNRWAVLSILITVTDAVLIYSVISFLDTPGLWKSSPPPRVHSVVSVWGGLSVLASLATALVGVAKGESKVLTPLALFLSILSFFFYVQ